MRLHRYFQTLLIHRKLRSPRMLWQLHHDARDRAQRAFRPDHYKSLHAKIRTAINVNDNTLGRYITDRVYLIEVVAENDRSVKTPRILSIGVYDHGYQSVHHGNYCPTETRYRDGVFYYMLYEGRLSKVSLYSAELYVKGLKKLATYRPTWQLK